MVPACKLRHARRVTSGQRVTGAKEGWRRLLPRSQVVAEQVVLFSQVQPAVDDHGVRGPLGDDVDFVLLGDQNADPLLSEVADGPHSINRLLEHERVFDPAPTSLGALAGRTAGAPDYFERRTHEVARIDYAVPSRSLEVTASGVFWPDQADPLHRLVASVLGLLIIALVFFSLRQKRQRMLSLTLLGLTVFLAVLGIRSGSLHNPAVVMGNLAGGFLMLGLLGWMVFSAGTPETEFTQNRTIKSMTIIAIGILCAQIFLGGLTSANFAATSCRTLPDCHGSWLPGSALLDAVDLSRPHEVTSMGVAVGGEERIAIHKAHRLGAVLTAIVILSTALLALASDVRFRGSAAVILVLLAIEFSVGIGAILSSLPIWLAVAHNWLAGLLLLGLLKLLSRATSR